MDIEGAKEVLGEGFGFTAQDANGVVQYLDLDKRSVVLDVGTGVGNMAITLALNGYSVITGEPETDDSAYAKQDWLSNSKKVGVDQQIQFEYFDALDTHFKESTFDAIFFFGSLHHIDKGLREKVLQESIRITKPEATICFFEPNPTCVETILKFDPSHPEPANPSEHSQGLGLQEEKKEGLFFDAYLFRKTPGA